MDPITATMSPITGRSRAAARIASRRSVGGSSAGIRARFRSDQSMM